MESTTSVMELLPPLIRLDRVTPRQAQECEFYSRLDLFVASIVFEHRGSCPDRRRRVNMSLSSNMVGGAMDGLDFAQTVDIGMQVDVLSTSGFLYA